MDDMGLAPDTRMAKVRTTREKCLGTILSEVLSTFIILYTPLHLLEKVDVEEQEKHMYLPNIKMQK